MAHFLLVNVPVTDLRTHPKPVSCHDFSHQSSRVSQLLYQEKLEHIQTRGDWIEVKALEQPRFFPPSTWSSYTGWIHQSEVTPINFFKKPKYILCKPHAQLSFGTYLHQKKSIPLHKLRPIPKKPQRQHLISDAKLFLNAPYLWGGRSSHLLGKIASVDCSSLINLLYRAQGVQIPRDAHDQFLASKPTQTLLPADLLYLAKNKRITHVILKLDHNLYLEAPETGKQVRYLSWNFDFWEVNGKIVFRDRPSIYTAFPRTFFD